MIRFEDVRPTLTQCDVDVIAPDGTAYRCATSTRIEYGAPRSWDYPGDSDEHQLESLHCETLVESDGETEVDRDEDTERFSELDRELFAILDAEELPEGWEVEVLL